MRGILHLIASGLHRLAWLAVIAAAAPCLGQTRDDPLAAANLPPLDGAATAATPLPGPPQLDPALVQPLPPLSASSTTIPNVFSATTAAELPDIRYRVVVDGLKGVGVEDQFRKLAALLEEGRKAANAAQIRARADEDVALAERLLRSQGYYDGTAAVAIGPLPDKGGELLVTLTATPGRRYHLGTIAVTGSPPAALLLARDALTLKTGEPIVADEVLAAEANVALRLPQQGYPFAKVGERSILLDDAAPVGDYSVPVTAGAKTRFGGIRVTRDPVFTAAHVALLPRFEAGDLYDSRRIEDLRQALIATSLLSSVSLEPVATGRINSDGTEVVDILVHEVEGPSRSLAGTIGYGTNEGVKLTGSWALRNIFPPEGALVTTVVAGTLEQSLGVQFVRSNAGRRDRTVQAGATVARQRYDAYSAETFDLNASISRVSTPIWQKRWTYSVGTELIASRETQFDQNIAVRDANTYFIAALPLQLGYDRSNSLLNPTTGFRLTAHLSPEIQQRASGGSAFDQYVRSLFEVSGYRPLTHSIVLAARGRIGAIAGASRDAIAPSRRLYSGGGGSVRGFGYQQLGPKDINNKPIGGRGLTEFAVEARYRFGNFGIVPFVDAGRVGVDPAPSIAGLRFGTGIGARYYTSFGPLRLDVATPIARRPGESKVAVYISIGQAF